jgi:prepilin-type N-terminal cleavage/methylation domain-containing protein
MTPARRPPAARERGFTLIEVMAAITIFLVGIVGVIGLLSAGTRLHQESQNLVVTNDVADEVLFLARREVAQASARLQPGELPAPAPAVPVPSHPDFRYAWKVTPAPDVHLFLLTVDVTWMESGHERTVSFERVLSRLVSTDVAARKLLQGGKG